MCGIAGAIAFLPSAISAQGMLSNIVTAMTESLGHRGPDDYGHESTPFSADADNTSSFPKVAFGHTRLSVLDLSSNGHQPMVDRLSGNFLTYNGEVYNFRELRARLRGPWESSTDTEVVLRAFSEWGTDALLQLRGMFALGLWDATSKQLILARDRFGMKPLYYYVGDGFLLFASEVRALLASGLVPRQLDRNALWHYLGYQCVPAPHTLVRGIRALLPGHRLMIRPDGTLSEHRYWDLAANASTEASTASASEAHLSVHTLLQEASALHMVSDVPVGAFLSGGIDSTAQVALARGLGHSLRTFSVVFSGNSQGFSEARFSRLASRSYKTDHSEIVLGESDLLDQLPQALHAMDTPSGDGVNTFVVSRAVRNAGIKVVLSGLGGDELFGGYPSFHRLRRAAPFFKVWRHMPTALRSLAVMAVSSLPNSSIRAAKIEALFNTNGSLSQTYPIMRQVLSSQQRELLFEKPSGKTSTPEDPYEELLSGAETNWGHLGFFGRVSYCETRTYMHDLLLRDTDQMSMCHGLEVRVPFLDHKLAEYVVALPDQYKESRGTPKRLLVEAISPQLPQQIVRRPKQGFTLPFEPWMRGHLRQFCEERLSKNRLGDRGIFEPTTVQKLWNDFLEGSSTVSWSRLWVLVALEEWLEHNAIESPA